MQTIPIIDLFAGPGGLGEGFTALEPEGGSADRVFRIALSIEKDKHAHNTLLLRTFFRQFPKGRVPETYYQYLTGTVTRETLFRAHPAQAEAAAKVAWLATLGKIRKEKLRSRIIEAIGGARAWVLIGGPPCQAYSLIGRARTGEDNEKDSRHVLYRHYLRVIAEHRPPVFVMENVRGLLSAKRKGQRIFKRMRSDLEQPAKALGMGVGAGYTLHGLAPGNGNVFEANDDFILRGERLGIPQARHRVIIVGVRNDLVLSPQRLSPAADPPDVFDVLFGLPPLRSRLSREVDSEEAWRSAVQELASDKWLDMIADAKCRDAIRRAAGSLTHSCSIGGPVASPPLKLTAWLSDPKLTEACNHEARGHMRQDLWRYLFAACFAQVHGRTPRLNDFPDFLMPKHKNVKKAEDRPFNDRFRVQCPRSPATTVTAHISKDGHYYIHHDPSQCRSWTVREAARIQTFPDNYFFEGPRTSQFQQVGNAVPPLLAHKIAKSIYKLLQEWMHG